MRSFGVIILVSFISISIVNGDGDMDFCAKVSKDHCDTSAGVRKNCPILCGAAPQAQPAQSQAAAAPAPQPQPQPQSSPSNNNNAPKPNSGSSGKHCDKRSPCVPLEDANAKFLQRCQATNGGLKDSCYAHCRYDEDTPTMKKAFLGGQCPLAQLRTYLTCASNGKDNSACCQDKGVLSQKKTDVCGCFCNPTGPVWPAKGEASKYAPCVNVLQGIMQCHQFAEGADNN